MVGNDDAQWPSSVPGFVSELVRAAKKVELLTTIERSRLMLRSATVIEDMGGAIASADRPTSRRIAHFSAELRSTAASPEVFTAENLSSILLSAADTIRTLRVLLDSEAEAINRTQRAEGSE